MGCFCQSNDANRGGAFVRTKANEKDLKHIYNLDGQVLGKGSFGTVYLATNKANPDLKIAIKAIDKRELKKADINSIHREVDLLQKVDHPNIINYYETYEDNIFVYLCMEHCKGGEIINHCKKSATFDEK